MPKSFLSEFDVDKETKKQKMQKRKKVSYIEYKFVFKLVEGNL